MHDRELLGREGRQAVAEHLLEVRGVVPAIDRVLGVIEIESVELRPSASMRRNLRGKWKATSLNARLTANQPAE